MKAGAVLCISCGYHTKLGGQLATVLDDESPQAVDANPYASPREGGEARPGPSSDLTESGARWAADIVRDAGGFGLAAVIFGCPCFLLWPFILPWYAFRLCCWYALNSRFAELRNPNSFSKHGELATRFQDAKLRLWLLAGLGVVYLLLLGLVIANAITNPNPASW